MRQIGEKRRRGLTEKDEMVNFLQSPQNVYMWGEEPEEMGGREGIFPNHRQTAVGAGGLVRGHVRSQR